MKHARGHIPLLILACSTLCVVIAAYAYMHHLIGASTEAVLAARQEVATAQANVADEQGLTEAYQSSAANRGKLSGFFIPADQAVSFIEALESIGTAAGSAVTLSTVSADPLQGAAPGTIGTAHASVDASGSWPSVMRTLMLAETLPYQISIDNVHLATSGDSSSKQPWHLTFDISASLLVGTSTTQQ